VDALKKMGTSLESELRSLLVYYGERPDSPEGNKPEDFFSLILSFSSALQVCLHLFTFSSAKSFCQKSAVEVHDAVDKSLTSKTVSPAKEGAETASEPVSHSITTASQPSANSPFQTIKGGQEPSSQSLLSPPTDSQGRAGGRQTVKRGDLDQAIRSMRDGKRRTRPNRPLSKIFLDGGRPSNRVFD
jgi:diaphanous 1